MKKNSPQACHLTNFFSFIFSVPFVKLVLAITISIDVNCILCNLCVSFLALSLRSTFSTWQQIYLCACVWLKIGINAFLLHIQKIIDAWHNNYNKGQGSFFSSLTCSISSLLTHQCQFHALVFTVIKVVHKIHINRRNSNTLVMKIQMELTIIAYHVLCICPWGKFMHVHCCGLWTFSNLNFCIECVCDVN